MTAELVVAGGLVVNHDAVHRAHVVVSGGVVTDLVDADQPVPAAERVVDASGLVVVPGGVDGHCHVAQVTGPYRTLDDFALTSSAALQGGTTTILDFGIPRDDSESPLEAARAKLRLAELSRCDVGLHGSVVRWDDTVPEQLSALVAMGITSVKVYMTNRGTTMADGDTVIRVMREMHRLGGLTWVHAEHDALVVDCTREHVRTGQAGADSLWRTRPALAEVASVQEVLALAEYTGASAYFVHQSVPEAVDLVTAARRRGLPVWSETCPHYAVLDESCYDGVAPEWFACCPPMRGEEQVRLLRDRIARGEVHTMSSDHSCYDLGQKREHRDDVRAMPHGLPGVETRLPATLTMLAQHAGGVDEAVLRRFVDLVAATPAEVNGLPGKGAVAPGLDADLVVLDPAAARTCRSVDLHMGSDFTPFEGRRLVGWPQVVVSAGQVVLDGAGFHDPGPVGRVLHRRGVDEWRKPGSTSTALAAGRGV